MRKTITIAVAAATLSFGGIAYAQSQERGEDLTRVEAQERAAERFARMDANNDGAISAADKEARARARFAKMDADNNGQISFAEMQAQHEQRREARHERRAENGTEGRRGGNRMGRRGHRGGGMMLERADADNNGTITQAEFTAAALMRFDTMDADNNGTVTAEERRANRGERRGRRGQ